VSFSQTSICCENLHGHVDQQSHPEIGDVLGKQISGACNLSSAAAELVQVDVIGTGTGGDNEAERREEAKHVDGEGVALVTVDGGHGGAVVGVGDRKLKKGKRRVV